MNNNDLWDELRIEKAAKLVDSDAPVQLDTERARRFVKETLGEKEETSAFAGFMSSIFKAPVYMWGGVGVLAVASLAIMLVLSPAFPRSDIHVMQELESVHANLDSLNTAADSLAVTDECIMDVEQIEE